MPIGADESMKKNQHAHENSLWQPGNSPAQSQTSALSSRLLLSVPEAAELLGLSTRTVYLLLASGELARGKVRRRTVLHRDDVIRFAARTSEGQMESEG